MFHYIVLTLEELLYNGIIYSSIPLSYHDLGHIKRGIGFAMGKYKRVGPTTNIFPKQPYLVHSSGEKTNQMSRGKCMLLLMLGLGECESWPNVFDRY